MIGGLPIPVFGSDGTGKGCFLPVVALPSDDSMRWIGFDPIGHGRPDGRLNPDRKRVVLSGRHRHSLGSLGAGKDGWLPRPWPLIHVAVRHSRKQIDR